MNNRKALNPDILPQFQQADAHRSVMLDLFSAVTNDCVNKQLQPTAVHVMNYDVYGGTGWTVNVQISGDVTAVDELADCYGLAPDDEEHGNYTRIGGTIINGTACTVVAYTGRPKDRDTLIREWVAANYSAESKRLVAEGAEALPEDQGKCAKAEAAGLFGASW